jgi:hypothetical protein
MVIPLMSMGFKGMRKGSLRFKRVGWTLKLARQAITSESDDDLSDLNGLCWGLICLPYSDINSLTASQKAHNERINAEVSSRMQRTFIMVLFPFIIMITIYVLQNRCHYGRRLIL